MKNTYTEINMKKVIWILIGVALFSLGSHFYFKITNTYFTFSYLKKFRYIPYINCYEKGEPRVYFGQQKATKAVLLLHGFDSAPSEFDHLIEQLKQEGIPFYAPLITGFGIGDFHLLNVVTKTDWLRDSIFGFDLLSSFAEKVDVIGHSNGGCLATLLASHRPVNQLILLDPYLFPKNLPTLTDRIIKRIVDFAPTRNILSFLYPVVKGPPLPHRIERMDVVDFKAAEAAFQFKGMPMHSVITVWAVQSLADEEGSSITDWSKETSCETPKPVFLLYGDKDETANIQEALAYFQKNQVPVQSKKYPNVAHDLLIDYNWKEPVSDILTILNENEL